MEQQKKMKVGILLMIYMIVLAHSSIAHNYDCEILKKRVVCKELNQPAISFPMDVTRGEYKHFNVFSDDVSLNTKKQMALQDSICPEVLVISPSCLTLGKRMDRLFYSRYIQPYSLYFFLRSPPLVKWITTFFNYL